MYANELLPLCLLIFNLTVLPGTSLICFIQCITLGTLLCVYSGVAGRARGGGVREGEGATCSDWASVTCSGKRQECFCQIKPENCLLKQAGAVHNGIHTVSSERIKPS